MTLKKFVVVFLAFFVVAQPSAYEIDLQARRLNYYPPKMWRVSHLLEKNQQMQLFYKYREKFFAALDLEQYAKDILK